MKDIVDSNSVQAISEKKTSSPLSQGKTIIIGISGKRHIPPNEKDKVYDDIKRIINNILREHNTAHFIGYTALASGADTIFAEVVKKEFHQPLRIILPFAAEEYKKDFTESDLSIFEQMIEENGIHEIAETVL